MSRKKNTQEKSELIFSSLNGFLNKGFIVLKLTDIERYSSTSEVKKYLHNLVYFRRKIMTFFEMDEKDKRLFQSIKSDFNPESSAYFPGWWSEFSYDDKNAYVDYSPEYLMSNNYYDYDKSTLFEPMSTKGRNTGVESKVCFPNQEGKEVCDFFDKYILKSIIKELSARFNFRFPTIRGLQFVTIYYDRAKKLSKHTDEIFFSAHIGPTDEGLFIVPTKSRKPIPISLDTGDILLFSGREFKYEMDLLNQKISNPLPHWAEAKKGRLTIALSTFVKSPR